MRGLLCDHGDGPTLLLGSTRTRCEGLLCDHGHGSTLLLGSTRTRCEGAAL